MIKLSQLVNELKLTDDMRIHMSKEPFELEPRTFTQRVTMKPSGFWYGFGPYGSKTIATTQNLEEAQEKLDSIANTIPYLIEDVLGANTGDIFVM